MANKSIQFRRNDIIVYDLAEAKDVILRNQQNYIDGEQVFCRYWAYKRGEFLLVNGKKQKLSEQVEVHDELIDVYRGYIVEDEQEKEVVVDFHKNIIDENGERIPESAATVAGLVRVFKSEDKGRHVEITFVDNYETLMKIEEDIEQLYENANDIANAVGLSGESSSVTLGYSAITDDMFISAATSVQDALDKLNDAITPIDNDDSIVVSGYTNMHKNIVKVSSDGIYAFADLHYDETTNKLQFINSNGTRDIELKGVNFIEHIEYNVETETLDIYYYKYGEEKTTLEQIPLKDLIEEYDFKGKITYIDDNDVEQSYIGSEANHNVAITAWRPTVEGSDTKISEKTPVYGEISLFDCGEY